MRASGCPLSRGSHWQKDDSHSGMPQNERCFQIGVEKKNKANKNHPRDCCMHLTELSFQRAATRRLSLSANCTRPFSAPCHLGFYFVPSLCCHLPACPPWSLKSCFHCPEGQMQDYPTNAKERQQGQPCNCPKPGARVAGVISVKPGDTLPDPANCLQDYPRRIFCLWKQTALSHCFVAGSVKDVAGK